MCTNCYSTLLQVKCYVINHKKDRVFVMKWYLYKYIHNVSHNSLNSLVISVANNEIIMLQIKIKSTNFSINSFTDSVVTKVSLVTKN